MQIYLMICKKSLVKINNILKNNMNKIFKIISKHIIKKFNLYHNKYMIY